MTLMITSTLLFIEDKNVLFFVIVSCYMYFFINYWGSHKMKLESSCFDLYFVKFYIYILYVGGNEDIYLSF